MSKKTKKIKTKKQKKLLRDWKIFLIKKKLKKSDQKFAKSKILIIIISSSRSSV